MTAGPALEADGVGKTYSSGAMRVSALEDVTLSLAANELTLLVGPSGSGKTTLLSILGCILTPTAGTVRIAGHSTTGLGPENLAALRRAHIGFVFQSYNLFPTLTAEENVRLSLDIRGTGGASARDQARRALDEVGLVHKLKAFPRDLSGGEQQRVAVARALAASPSVIFADEPTAALDSENGRIVMTLLAEIAKKPSRTVLAVTHDPRTLSFADRIIRIEDGRITGEERCGGQPARSREHAAHA